MNVIIQRLAPNGHFKSGERNEWRDICLRSAEQCRWLSPWNREMLRKPMIENEHDYREPNHRSHIRDAISKEFWHFDSKCERNDSGGVDNRFCSGVFGGNGSGTMLYLILLNSFQWLFNGEIFNSMESMKVQTNEHETFDWSEWMEALLRDRVPVVCLFCCQPIFLPRFCLKYYTRMPYLTHLHWIERTVMVNWGVMGGTNDDDDDVDEDEENDMYAKRYTQCGTVEVWRPEKTRNARAHTQTHRTLLVLIISFVFE